jgi:hypothetical protein
MESVPVLDEARLPTIRVTRTKEIAFILGLP